MSSQGPCRLDPSGPWAGLPGSTTSRANAPWWETLSSQGRPRMNCKESVETRSLCCPEGRGSCQGVVSCPCWVPDTLPPGPAPHLRRGASKPGVPPPRPPPHGGHIAPSWAAAPWLEYSSGGPARPAGTPASPPCILSKVSATLGFFGPVRLSQSPLEGAA